MPQDEKQVLERLEKLMIENNNLLRQNIDVMKNVDEKLRKITLNTA